MNGATAVVGAFLTMVGTVVVGYFTLRASVRLTQAKEKTDQNTLALQAWRELVQPLREEIKRLGEARDRDRLECAAELAAQKLEHSAEIAALRLEHEAVLAALEPLNERLRRIGDEQADSGD